MKHKILLHTCCGACFLATEPELKNDYQVISFYYNPNIWPKKEFEKRKESLKKVIKVLNEKDNKICHSGILKKYPESIRIDNLPWIPHQVRDDIWDQDDIKIIMSKWNHKDWDLSINKNLPSYLDIRNSSRLRSNNRCVTCWKVRLEKTAQRAKKLNLKYFSSTLLSSPYQDFNSIVTIGRNLAKKYNLNFIDQDFRKNYRSSQNLAKELKIYRQKYCGCRFSINRK